MINLTTLTDEELEAHRLAVLTEQERRAALETIPATVADLATKYRDGGGNTDDLKAAIDGDAGQAERESTSDSERPQ